MAVAEAIELECPVCAELLEIDIGFAGGICRCSNCGALMTVPSHTGGERAERVGRPDRPDGPPRPQGPTQTGSTTTPTLSNRPTPSLTTTDTTHGSSDLSDPNVERSLPKFNELPSNTFVTESGRTIQIDEASIPTARKRERKMVRATTTIIVLAVLASVVGLCFAAVTIVVNTGKTDDPNQHYIETAEILPNPDNNPLLTKKSGFFNLPLAARPVIAIDGSGGSRDWFSLVADVTLWSAAQLPPDHPLQIVVWPNDGPQAFPEKLQPFSDSDRAILKHKFERFYPDGRGDVAKAVALALQSKPTQIIVVSSQHLEPDAVVMLETLLNGDASAVRVDFIFMAGAQSSAIKAYAAKRANGRYVEMPFNTANRWFMEWESQASQEEQERVLATNIEPPADFDPDAPFGPKVEITLPEIEPPEIDATGEGLFKDDAKDAAKEMFD